MGAASDTPANDNLKPTGVIVECHSGYTYPERPRAFIWDDKRVEVEAIAAEWQTPDSKHFRVTTVDRQIFELVYDLSKDEWKIFRQEKNTS